MPHGYNGKVLHRRLAQKPIEIEVVSLEFYRKYMDGIEGIGLLKEVVEWAKDKYYKLAGCDQATAAPTQGKLRAISLE